MELDFFKKYNNPFEIVEYIKLNLPFDEILVIEKVFHFYDRNSYISKWTLVKTHKILEYITKNINCDFLIPKFGPDEVNLTFDETGYDKWEYVIYYEIICGKMKKDICAHIENMKNQNTNYFDP